MNEDIHVKEDTIVSDSNKLTVLGDGLNISSDVNLGYVYTLGLSNVINRYKNNELAPFGLAIIIILLIASILSSIVYHQTKNNIVPSIETLKVEIVNSKKVIKLKIPLHKLIIEGAVILTLFIISISLEFIVIDEIWNYHLGVMVFFLYSFYRLAKLLFRKVEINLLNGEIILYTPFKRKTSVDMIVGIDTASYRSIKNYYHYYIRVKVKNKSHGIRFDTTSDDQSIALKKLIEEHIN